MSTNGTIKQKYIVGVRRGMYLNRLHMLQHGMMTEGMIQAFTLAFLQFLRFLFLC